MWGLVHFQGCNSVFTDYFRFFNKSRRYRGVDLLQAVGRRETACEDEEEEDPEECPPHCERVHLRHGARLRGEERWGAAFVAVNLSPTPDPREADEQEKDPEERPPYCESVHLDDQSVEIIQDRIDGLWFGFWG